MIDSTLESPDVCVATEDDITKFCTVTGDDNKVHQGPNPIVPGFWIDFKAKNKFDAKARAKDVQLNLAGLDIKFREVVYKDQPFSFEYQELPSPEGTLVYKVRAIREGVLVAEGMMRYSRQLEKPEQAKLDRRIMPYKSPGRVFAFSEEYFDGVAEALKIDRQDKIAGAVSRVSNVLQNDQESQSILQDAGRENKYPYFARHDLTIYEGANQALETGGIIIHIRKAEPKLGQYPVYVRGIDINRKPIFDLVATIRFT